MQPPQDLAAIPPVDKAELQSNLQTLNDATRKINDDNAAIQSSMTELLGTIKDMGEKNTISRESLGLLHTVAYS